jgi:hypothetical protein
MSRWPGFATRPGPGWGSRARRDHRAPGDGVQIEDPSPLNDGRVFRKLVKPEDDGMWDEVVRRV